MSETAAPAAPTSGGPGVFSNSSAIKREPQAEEDPEALAAIDEGLRDVEAGRIVPAEPVRAMLVEADFRSVSSAVR
ncbi:MAG: hypothetical protein WA715_12585 [Candidatus Acidiferrum sp.]